MTRCTHSSPRGHGLIQGPHPYTNTEAFSNSKGLQGHWNNTYLLRGALRAPVAVKALRVPRPELAASA